MANKQDNPDQPEQSPPASPPPEGIGDGYRYFHERTKYEHGLSPAPPVWGVTNTDPPQTEDPDAKKLHRQPRSTRSGIGGRDGIGHSVTPGGRTLMRRSGGLPR